MHQLLCLPSRNLEQLTAGLPVHWRRRPSRRRSLREATEYRPRWEAWGIPRPNGHWCRIRYPMEQLQRSSVVPGDAPITGEENGFVFRRSSIVDDPGLPGALECVARLVRQGRCSAQKATARSFSPGEENSTERRPCFTATAEKIVLVLPALATSGHRSTSSQRAGNPATFSGHPSAKKTHEDGATVEEDTGRESGRFFEEASTGSMGQR